MSGLNQCGVSERLSHHLLVHPPARACLSLTNLKKNEAAGHILNVFFHCHVPVPAAGRRVSPCIANGRGTAASSFLSINWKENRNFGKRTLNYQLKNKCCNICWTVSGVKFLPFPRCILTHCRQVALLGHHICT